MVGGTGLEAGAELEAVRVRIDWWRRTRSKRGAMPEDLWAEAMALGKRLGVHPVSQRLRLNYDRLKLRLVESELREAQAGVGGSEPVTGVDNIGLGVPTGFVELRAASPIRACGRPTSVAEVELARPDGARITFRMAGEQELDLSELSEAFFGGGR